MLMLTLESKPPVWPRIVLALCVLWFCAAQTASAQSLTTEQLFEKGAAASKAKDFKKAIDIYTKVLEDKNLTASQKAGVFFNRGNAWESLGLYGQAIADYTRALEAEESFVFYINRGRAWWQNGALDKAAHDYTKAIGLQPQSAPAYNNRSVIFEQQGKLNKALADMQKATELAPKHEPYKVRLDQLKKKANQAKPR